MSGKIKVSGRRISGINYYPVSSIKNILLHDLIDSSNSDVKKYIQDLTERLEELE